jgi:hypothetical protein
MSMTKTTTAKSVIFSFDGFSEGYGAYVQGAFVGKFIVPKQHAHLVGEGYELSTLREMHQSHRFGIVLRDASNVQ